MFLEKKIDFVEFDGMIGVKCLLTINWEDIVWFWSLEDIATAP